MNAIPTRAVSRKRHLAYVLIGGALFGLGWPSVLGTGASVIPPILGLALLLRHAIETGRSAGAAAGLALGNAVALVWLPLSIRGGLAPSTAWLGWLALSLYGAGYPAIALAIAEGLHRRRGLSWSASLPSLWLLSELARARVFGGHDWVSLGYSAAENPLGGRLYAEIGAHGVSALLVLCASLIADLSARAESIRFLAPQTGTVAMICLSPWVLFGARRDALAETSADARVSIAAVQGSIDDPEWASAMSDAADSGAPLIVTAEGAGAGAPFAALGSVHVLLGTQTGCGKLDGRRCVQNSVVHYDTDGRMKGQYDKQLLVPLYERDFAFWRAQEASIMKPGEGPGIFEVEGIRVGVAICYEIVDSALVSRLSEAGATLIVHPTSDAWQSGRTAIAQHLAVARVRAAETGLPILRVSNREGTVLVRPDGSVTPLVRPDAAAVALAMVDRTPVHTYFGSNRKFVVASQAATAILLVLGALLRRAALRREA